MVEASHTPDIVVVDRYKNHDFQVDLTPHPQSIVLTRPRRLHEPFWRSVFQDYGPHRPINFMEVGCQEGGATTWFLEHLLSHPDSRMTAVDIFPPRVYETLTHNITVGGWARKTSIYRGKSGEVLRTFPLYSFDVIYVDGLHAALAVIEDAILSWRLLKEGGILLFDDYEWTGQPSPLNRPKPSIDFFLQSFVGKYEIIGKQYQLAIKKLYETQLRKII